MHQTQLVCQHCGSTLNFGAEIAPGTMVNCLICMRSFAAGQPVAAAASPAKPKAAAASAKLTPKASPDAVKPAAPSISKPAAPAASNSSLMLVLAGVLLLLTAGIGVGVWKMTTSTGPSAKNPPDSTDGPIASNKDKVTPPKNTDDSKLGSPKDGTKKTGESKDTGVKNGNADKAKQPADKKGKTEDDPDDDRDKKKPEVEPKLIRKDPVKPPPVKDPEPDPIQKIKEQKPAPPPVKLVGVDQAQINTAIDRGVAYLKKEQQANGTWTMQGHSVGYAALGGLTLLESGVAANDAAVQRAAEYVRANLADLGKTYDLAATVLFLDRLGDPRDRPVIQGVALRILAGQLDSGGWDYDCQKISPQDMYQLFNFLHAMKSFNLLNPQGRITKLGLNPVRDPLKSDDPFQQLNTLILTHGIPGANAGPQKEFDPNDPKREKSQVKAGAPIRFQDLPPHLRALPVAALQGRAKGQLPAPRTDELPVPGMKGGSGDNSNTQFALLALWAARRHDVPTDYAVAHAYKRFMVSQAFDGGWPYSGIGGTRPTMTCVGLLGLALGHGVAPDYIKFDAKNPKNTILKPALQDASIKRGLQALAGSIGQPNPNVAQGLGPGRQENLYLLWSIERVAMLYDLKAIEGKDWYSWGAQILVHSQGLDGGWGNGGEYTGASPTINTCLALLFLRRSNLVHDLTNDLRLFSPIQSPK